MLDVEVFGFSELRQQFSLGFIQLLRYDELKNHNQVASIFRISQHRGSEVRHPHDRPVLGSGGDLQIGGATFEKPDLDVRSQGRLGECHRDHGDQVVPITLESIVILDGDHHVQVASRPVTIGLILGARGFPLSLDPNDLTVADAGGNADFQTSTNGNPATASAFAAVFGDDLASSPAVGAGDDHAEHAAQTGLFDLAGSFTGRALDGFGAGFGPAALAGSADIQAPEFHFASGPFQRVLECDLDLNDDFAFARPLDATTPTAADCTILRKQYSNAALTDSKSSLL